MTSVHDHSFDFQPVFITQVPYLKSEYGQDYDLNAPVSLLTKLFHGFPESPDHQVCDERGVGKSALRIWL